MRCLILIRTHTISIHALTRSATRNSSNQFMSTQIFQSTHSQGVRLWFIPYTYYTNSHFNPRTHKECDINLQDTLLHLIYFNPRTHKECDELLYIPILKRLEFQSMHSQGVRQVAFLKTRQPPRISIHALTRSATDRHGHFHLFGVISIHALTRSATTT